MVRISKEGRRPNLKVPGRLAGVVITYQLNGMINENLHNVSVLKDNCGSNRKTGVPQNPQVSYSGNQLPPLPGIADTD